MSDSSLWTILENERIALAKLRNSQEVQEHTPAETNFPRTFLEKDISFQLWLTLNDEIVSPQLIAWRKTPHSCIRVVILRGDCNPRLLDAQIDLHGKIMQRLSPCEIAVGIFHCICWICSHSDLASISSLLASILSLSLSLAARICCCHLASQNSNICTQICRHTHTHTLEISQRDWASLFLTGCWDRAFKLESDHCGKQMFLSDGG